jgi:RNA polymerase sigma-70 factor (ECF subfamily)
MKRGGGQVIISWEQHTAEQRFQREPADVETPEMFFERRWALTVLEEAAQRLKAEYQAAGRAGHFSVLKGYVTAEGHGFSYAESAARLGLSESAVKSAIHRMRRRYHELVRDEVEHTVADPRELEEEIRHLLIVFSKSRATFDPESLNSE